MQPASSTQSKRKLCDRPGKLGAVHCKRNNDFGGTVEATTGLLGLM
jgi:hypothetical protein